jgi:hypothetical protein
VGVYATTICLAVKKHPYLIYAGVLSASVGFWAKRGTWTSRSNLDDEFEVLDDENPEIVKEKIVGLRDWIGVGIAGMGFAIAVVGAYGEGFTD